jgi:hypothetical protein
MPAGSNARTRSREDIAAEIYGSPSLTASPILSPDHDAVGMLEVVDRGAFAQKLRIRHYGKVAVRLV